MAEKIWQVPTNKKTKDIISILLANRGVVTEKQKQEFFSPTHPAKISLKEFGINPSQIEKAIVRIKKAKKQKEKVIVYGDYDCDGICSSAILWQALHKLGLNVLPFIPNRFSDGYGMRQSTIEKIKKDHPDTSLIITVDNGIVANVACKFASSVGIDVIITDHHEKSAKLPKCISIVHTTKTSGSGVAWVLARELGDADDLLPFAAIGTVADQLPLLGVNRSIVKHGLEILRQSTRSIGLRALIKESGIDQQTIGTYEIGFLLAPRINAMGRMGDATDSLRLLCTTNSERAQDLSRQLNLVNSKRQTVVEEAIVHATKILDKKEGKMLTFLAHESYHEGIIGLAASRLVETYSKPAIVIAKAQSFSKGSARSISGLHITEVLREVGHLLHEVGGHEMAAGFTIETSKLEEFENLLQNIIASKVTEDMLKKRLRIDAVVNFKALNWDLSEKLQLFEPFGLANPQPIFVSHNVEILEKKVVGAAGIHAKLKLKQGSSIFDAIAFGWAKSNIEINQKIDLAYNLETNVWNGSKSLQLKVKDIKL